MPDRPLLPVFFCSTWAFSSLFRWGAVQSKTPTATSLTPIKSHDVISKAPPARGAPAAAGLTGSAGSGSSNDGPSCTHPSSSPFSLAKPWTWFRSRGSKASCCGCDEAAVVGGYQARCRTGVTDAGLPLSKFPAASFDTVIDSFGLCSHEDPVQASSVIQKCSSPLLV